MDPSGPPKQSSTPSFFTFFIATGLYSGYMPWASGTFGSLVGLLLYLIPGFESRGTMMLLILVFFFIGVYVSGKVAESVGNRLTTSAQRAKQLFQPGGHTAADPSIVVIDEIVGMWITLYLLPKTIPVIVSAFLLFRLFDIVKPFPARELERVPGGWGIMLDDVVAGVYGNIAIWAAYWFLLIIT